MKSQCRYAALLACIICLALKGNTEALPDAGPESAGVSMRLLATPVEEGWDVSVEIATRRDITLKTDWRSDEDNGGLKDYIEAAISIETYPAIEPWIGGLRETYRTAPQFEQVLKAGEVLTIGWHATGRLKNRVLNPQEVQNPAFPVPGMYSVHATLVLPSAEGPLLLRSNEALISIGGSRELPRHTYGRFLGWGGDAEHQIGTLGLGWKHKVQAGDQFLIGYLKTGQWRMTITQVDAEAATGRLEPVPAPEGWAKREPVFPERLSPATLVLK